MITNGIESSLMFILIKWMVKHFKQAINLKSVFYKLIIHGIIMYNCDKFEKIMLELKKIRAENHALYKYNSFSYFFVCFLIMDELYVKYFLIFDKKSQYKS